MNNSDELNKLVNFKDTAIRRILHNNEWWFSVIDVVGALSDSNNPGAYWRKLKQRLSEEKSEVVTNCPIVPDSFSK